jgi:hypothetical protein
MNKNILPILLTGTLLCGCGAATTAAPETSTETETSSETEVSGTTQSDFSTEASEKDGTVATVQGPYGSDACIRICQNYLSENDGDAVNTVTNWDNPSVTVVDELPDDYYQISDDTDSEKYFKVVFTTTADELLGSIDFFVDETGNIIGQNYRE